VPSCFSQEEPGKAGRESDDLYGSKPSVTALGSAFEVPGTILAVPAAVVIGILVEELWFKRNEEVNTHRKIKKEKERDGSHSQPLGRAYTLRPGRRVARKG
jgi:hypothetical protein